MRPVLTLTAALMSATMLTSGAASAQTGPALETLVRGSLQANPMRSIDLTARAANRYAIVIGNSDYADIPDLPNAHADARVVSEFLKEQGYDVKYHEDITKRGFEDVLRRVLFDVNKDTEVVVFFAGHGFQIGAENYLVPVDADLDSVYDVPFEAVSLGSLVGIIGARARLQVVILDSCRDNPFAGKEVLTQIGNELRETRTGFASLAAPLNSMMIYSTSPGSVAFDGEGENSPFTAALIDEASARPDALVKDVFEGVRRAVFEKTNGRQVPWDSSTLIEPASFGIGAALSKPIIVDGNGGGASRGLARIIQASAETDAPALPADAVAALDAPFVDEVEIGAALRNALDLTPADTVVVETPPETGRLVLTDDAGFRRNIAGEAISANDVDRLILVNESVQVPALSLENGLIEDSVTISVNGETRRIALNLAPNPCDFHAGDHLDPDGMGITRYANEMQPELALEACEAAIANEPDVGRFHYQLGRALTALRRNDEATLAYEKARELNHARAWNALGVAASAEERRTGGQTNQKASDEVLQLFARGVEEGDPYAFYSLGREFMRYGATPEIEIEGYDLMMRSLEVGHTFAMNELGYFYLDEGSEYHDPERGLRYLRESAARDDIYGFNNMGLVYRQGLGGTEVDNAQAYELFTKATVGGHPVAPVNLAFMYRDGLAPGGVDRVKAVENFDTSLNRGYAWGGNNAAFLISDGGVSGYDMFDAAVFGAKGAALVNQEEPATRARNLIASFDRRALDGGAQKLINDLGGDVTVDGAFGPGSSAALDEVLARFNAGPAESDPVDRIIQLATLYWTTSPFRVDLY